MYAVIIIFMHVLTHDELAKHVPCSLSDYHIAFSGGANFSNFRDYPASHEIFHPRNFPPMNFQSVIAHALHNLENTV